MIKNFKNNTLTDSLASGAAAIALIAGVGIAATPAQASTLGWSNGTSDFFNGVGNPNFQVIFSPDVTQDPLNDGIGAASIDNADGVFVPPFQGAPPIFLESIQEAVGNFDIVVDGGTGIGATGIYELADPLTFVFPDITPENGAPEVSVTWDAGTEFDYIFDTDNSVEFRLAASQPAPMVTGIDFEDETFLDDGLEFEDGSLPAGGEYLAEVEYNNGPTVPEPGTILGLLAIGGLGLGLKRKQQSKQLSA
ncbi:MAG: PEP-CTERM sorting domain-containing protein [Xenococcaceae cyanobacterium MO_188.B29]|nr:PEP-CTERM sorting domain-containing protein [Xenococcaceae cyanobacterium MO_188.B29]